MKSYKTELDKQIRTKWTPQGKVEVYFYPGGAMPESLSGIFTSEAEAEKAILCYLSRNSSRKNTRATDKE